MVDKEKKVFIQGQLAVEFTVEGDKVLAINFRDRVPGGQYRTKDGQGEYKFIGRHGSSFNYKGIRVSFKSDEKGDVDTDSIEWTKCGVLRPRSDIKDSGSDSRNDKELKSGHNDFVGDGQSASVQNGQVGTGLVVSSERVENDATRADGTEQGPREYRSQRNDSREYDKGHRKTNVGFERGRGRGRGRAGKRTTRGRLDTNI